MRNKTFGLLTTLFLLLSGSDDCDSFEDESLPLSNIFEQEATENNKNNVARRPSVLFLIKMLLYKNYTCTRIISK